MARQSSLFVCQSCGSTQTKWVGRCPACETWNSLVEETHDSSPLTRSKKPSKRTALLTEDLQSSTPSPPRFQCTLSEFDRVCGGGLVQGSVILIGGDPGVGKSTLLLQVAALLSKQHPTLYVSGEEAIDQVRLRAHRLGLKDTPLKLLSSTHIHDIITTVEQKETSYKLAIIDSIQTMYSDAIDAAPGTVSQVRLCCQELMHLAKTKGIIIVLIGHVTKEGTLAGPRVLEHMVDAVLYFEGEKGHSYRILRATKNRFGPTDEIGVFEMRTEGLQQVCNPSGFFLSERQGMMSGSAVFAGMEGTRPLLIEIQALVSPASFGTPRRAVIGWDSGRLAMILAVLETRCGLNFGTKDVYLNVAGGLKISEPAADLAVAAALMSSLTGVTLPGDAIFYGEISLTGEIRSVSNGEGRQKEAQKLGFKQAFTPREKSSALFEPERFKSESFSFLRDFVSYFHIHDTKGARYA